MLPVISALLACVVGLFRSRASLCLEHLALQHQLAVYQQTVRRPRLHTTDRLFWAWLLALWSGWQTALAFVQPRTVIAWQRKRFRDHWRRLRQRDSRPACDYQGGPRSYPDHVAGHPTWGSPDRGGIAGAGHRRGQIDGGEISGTTAEATVTDVEDLPAEPHEGPGGPGFLCRADGAPQSALRAAHPGP